jgi:thiosulfate/3-mercaptopyruvate sulfurtransferase
MSGSASRRAFFLFALVIAFVLPSLTLLRAQNKKDPWTVSQTVQAADLAKELAAGKSNPMILFVGFQRLYTAGHIKGTQYRGAGSNAEGLVEIKKWAGSLPRSMNLVIYCGCCPMEKCPNIRPALAALRDMGFSNLRVLILPTSFAVDWAEMGLPYEKGK